MLDEIVGVVATTRRREEMIVEALVLWEGESIRGGFGRRGVYCWLRCRVFGVCVLRVHPILLTSWPGSVYIFCGFLRYIISSLGLLSLNRFLVLLDSLYSLPPNSLPPPQPPQFRERSFRECSVGDRCGNGDTGVFGGLCDGSRGVEEGFEYGDTEENVEVERLRFRAMAV